MSCDTSGYVEGVPVKVCEKYRPPRRIILPASCNYQINPDLFIQEYSFTSETETLNWIEENKKRKDQELQARNDRLSHYDKEKADRKAKLEEETQLRIKEEEERLLKEKEDQLLRENEEKERILRLKEEENEKEIEKQTELAVANPLEQNDEEDKTNDDNIEKSPPVSEPLSQASLTQSVSQDLEDNNSSESASCEEGLNKKDLNDEEATINSDSDTTININPNNKSVGASSNNCNPDQSSPYNPFSSSDTSSNVQVPVQQNNPIHQKTIQSYNPIPDTKAKQEVNYPNMLFPTLIPPQGNYSSANSSNLSNINFADFEGDANDPFNNAALKSINDMEELALVLQSSTIDQKNNEPKQEIKSNINSGQPEYNGVNHYSYYPQSGNDGQQNYNQFGQSVTSITSTATATASPPVPSCNTSYDMTRSNTYTDPYYSTQYNWNNSYMTDQTNKISQSPYNSYIYNSQHNASAVIASSVPTIAASNMSTFSTSVTQSSQQQQQQQQQSTISQPGQRPDLEDFYSKYYMNNKSNNTTGARSGDATPVHNGCSPLRSCRSVPDLTQPEDDDEVSHIIEQVPDLCSSYTGFTHTLPSRPSSTGLTGLEDWKPLPSLPDSPQLNNSPKTVISSSRYSSLPRKNRLPDPFAELDPEAQSLVQGVAEMGFPRPMVSRAVQKLGTDHKKLIEVVLILQNLQENGEDGYRAERAFYHFMGDVDKTMDHLNSSKQLLDLGFEEEKIVNLLLKHDNNRDKALEELIS